MWLFVEPFDVWLFRDARPFTAGEHVRATSMFPPLPTTFQGVIRSAALARALEQRSLTFEDFRTGNSRVRDLRERWGGAADFGQLSLRGPFVARRGPQRVGAWLPAPRDLFTRGTGAEARFVVAAPDALRSGESVRGGLAATCEEASLGPDERIQWRDWPTNLGLAAVAGSLPPASDSNEEVGPAPSWLPVAQFRRYLLGALSGEPVENQPDGGELVHRDLRVGIERDSNTGTAAHGRLYLAHFVRPAPGVGLVAEVTLRGVPDADSGFEERGLLAIGGEGRGGRYERLSQSPLASIDEDPTFRAALKTRLGTGRFKLVLVTPGLFRHGWCPDFIDPTSLEGHLDGVSVRLVGAVVDKPVPVAGRDLANNRPRALRWAVPPGTTYTFEVQAGAQADWPGTLLAKRHGRSIADPGWPGGCKEVGMALVLVGAV